MTDERDDDDYVIDKLVGHCTAPEQRNSTVYGSTTMTPRRIAVKRPRGYRNLSSTDNGVHVLRNGRKSNRLVEAVVPCGTVDGTGSAFAIRIRRKSKRHECRLRRAPRLRG